MTVNIDGIGTPHSGVRISALFLAVGLLIAGCGNRHKDAVEPKNSPRQSATTPSPTTYSADHVRSSLLKAREISSGMQQSDVGVIALQKGQAPMCSLTGVKLRGSPEVTTRQFIDPRDRQTEPRYAQFVSIFSEQGANDTAFRELQQKAGKCPKKQHVAAKKIKGNFLLFQHDDTWVMSTDKIAGWNHVRGFEKHVEPPSDTKRNVFYISYDYTARGNVLLATMYWERTDPSDDGSAIAKRATQVLTRQLNKIG